jgi:hypothetical protein
MSALPPKADMRAGEAILAHLATLPPGANFTRHVGLAHSLAAHAPSFGNILTVGISHDHTALLEVHGHGQNRNLCHK